MDDIKSRIVAAARALYTERGPDAVTMRAVADRVGVTATALYRHFRDKDAILQEVLGEGSRLIGSHLFAALEGATAADRLRATAAAYLAFAREQPQAYRAMFDPASTPDTPAGRQRGALGRFIADRVREAAQEAANPALDVEGSALSLWAALHGHAALQHSGITIPATALEHLLTIAVPSPAGGAPVR
ncbi:MAG TPA: TetR/AcrR family transcriptional regulator [Longimicrobium sp.]|nr:TetR/AcrR family transcriptional regulator [Longimicrobium sp.]